MIKDIIALTSEAIENGYSYTDCMDKLQKEYALGYATVFRIHKLMVDHDWNKDSSYEQFSKEVEYALAKERSLQHIVVGKEYEARPYTEGKRVVFLMNHNLSSDDQSDYIGKLYNGVMWNLRYHMDYEDLYIFVPPLTTLDEDYPEILQEIVEFVYNERDICITVDEALGVIAETDDTICYMLKDEVVEKPSYGRY